MMVTYYARKLLDKFWRRRSPQRRERMLRVLCASITHKVVLLDFLSRMRWRDAEWMIVRAPGDCSVWEAIARQEGYTRANSIHRYAHLFSEAEIVRAYDAAQAMASPFRERSLAAIYPRVDEAAKDRILAVLLQELAGTSWEAAAQLKCMFHMLDPERRTRVVQAS
ncbi:hypothetical protein SAMN05428948_4384 [Massilia sp. CF038]|nr:hypothetical protein SAMN05428948_4384 [Massilia sp. CF038]